jgi:colicin import membrane protein
MAVDEQTTTTSRAARVRIPSQRVRDEAAAKAELAAEKEAAAVAAAARRMGQLRSAAEKHAAVAKVKAERAAAAEACKARNAKRRADAAVMRQQARVAADKHRSELDRRRLVNSGCLTEEDISDLAEMLEGGLEFAPSTPERVCSAVAAHRRESWRTTAPLPTARGGGC